MNAEMQLPHDFLLNLREETDWTFVIKAHVYAEALLSHAILCALGNERIAQQISCLTMRNKIEWAATLGLIGKDGKRFLSAMSMLRNKAAHDISAFTFSFAHLFDGDVRKRKERVNDLAYFASEEDIRSRWQIVEGLLVRNTKESVWWSLIHLTGVIWWKKENARLQNVTDVIKRQVRESLDG